MIRRATLEDLEGLVEVGRQVQQLHRRARPERYRDASRDEIARHLRALLEEPRCVVLVADVAGAVVGYAVVRRVDDPGHVHALPRVAAHVDDLGVREDARRAGHGRALVAAAEDQGRAWGAGGVSLDVQAFNRDAVAFYEALGYAFSSHRMVKPLG
jgi:diamine N-acetyltransferase